MIREATIDDLSDVAEMSQRFYTYAIKDKGLRFSPSDFVKYCSYLIDNPVACMLVADVEGKSVGTIAGILSSWFMDFSQLVVTEQWWWVDPDYRKGGHSIELLDSLIYWSKKAGAEKIIMASIVSDQDKLVKRYYLGRGFIPMENHFIGDI